MKLNSINAYNQSMKTKSHPNFGMAKFANPETIVELSKSFNPHYVSEIISGVKSTGCKNSIIGLKWNRNIDFETYVDGLTLSFPGQSQRAFVNIDDIFWKGKNLSNLIPKAEKNLVKIYATALTEMSSEANRSLIKRNLTDAADGQNLIFCEMQRQGFYEVAPATKEKLLEAREQFCN